MSGPATKQVFLPANQKTLVIWTSFVFKTYQVHFPAKGVQIAWERNSDLPPFHTFGKHNSGNVFGATVAGFYCNFWLTSPVAQTVTVAA